MSAYYRSRPPSTEKNWDEHYFGEVLDPDGNPRKLLEERERKIEDMKDEIAFVNSLEPGMLLDAGCGLGWFLSAIHPAWGKWGAEPCPRAANYARRHGHVLAASLGEFVNDAALSLEEVFDVVVAYHVIEHVDDPLTFIRQVRWPLCLGGHLVISTPDFESPCAKLFGDNFRLLHDPSHISLFSRDGLRDMLRDNGFTVDRIETPFFGTRHCTEENLLRMLDPSKMSPPFVGNIITAYARKTGA